MWLAGHGEAHPDSGDRRRGMRVRQVRPVKLYVASADRYVGGETRDVSSTGLRLELPAAAPIAEGRLVALHVGVGDQPAALVHRRQMIPARVVWVRRSLRIMGRIEAGIEFAATLESQMGAA